MNDKGIWCDPPSGWRYGFPKLIPPNTAKTQKSLHNWLVKNGYPRKEIKSYGDRFYCRFWYHEGD